MNRPSLPMVDTPVKILVVDDHPNTATMLARAISQLGPQVKVASATSASEALRHAGNDVVDILITDMVMPEMTGLELIEQLNSNPAGRPAFSFLITAYDVPGLKVSANRLKVKEVIVKPVHPERICQIVARAMDEMHQAKTVHKEPIPQKSFTILIADDQPDNLTLLARYLSNEGYKHIKAKDGVETLTLVRSDMPDLVLLDVNMPRKDGFAVLEEIRADPAIQHIPVIILTAAKLDLADIQSGLNMGADDYVTKPFDRRELLARIRTKLRVKQAEDVIRRRNRELNLLPEIGKELSARLNIDELTTVLLKRTVETLGAMFGHILILNPTGTYEKTFRLESSSSDFTLPQGLFEIVNESRQGFIVDDTQTDPLWRDEKEAFAGSAVVVPMFGRHSLLGILVLTNEQTKYFTLDHLLLLQAITSQASIALENAQLYNIVSREQQQLAAVLQNAADAILVFDAEYRLTLVNPAAQKLFTDYETNLGQTLEAGAGYDSFLALLNQTQDTNASFAGEVVWPDQRVFSASATPLEQGGCVVILHDVTRFKELERVKDEFIAIASHDLRNPITSIKGFGHLIKQAGPLNDNQTEFVERIQNSTETMSELVENLLDLAKMDLGEEPAFEILDATRLLTDIADEFKPQAEAKGLWLTLGKTGTSSHVRGDALQIRQALRNLIGNAVKYTPEGGGISLSSENQPGQVCLHIRDNGYGIPASDLPHIFDRFYRVRNNGHDDVKGNGLGLAIVKMIAEEHGGSVAVESAQGEGTCFSLILPLVAEA
ncbi:MAG: Sensor histidine kinase RcsC [Anaerolineales bacterium]|nr:Sensor histidine kinase RcsC [Anaerolineales bacterium]